MENVVFKRIEKDLEENDVVLFMKGTAEFPQCGFSSVAAQIMQQLGVTFKDINVLEDREIWQGIKDFTDWPTIPQLYVKKEFVGGCDIMREMYQEGELHTLLRDKKVAFNDNSN